MATAIRFRTGIDANTGKILTGWAHLCQSLHKIWMTRVAERTMLLEFGSNLRGLLSEDVTPALALEVYNELVTSAHRWEPEYRIDEFQLVSLKADGALGFRHAGLYYPEGRFGNYDLAIPMRAAPERFALGGNGR